MGKRIYLCLAHMSGAEQAFIQEAFDTNWVVPLGPNVNGFEEDLKNFVGEGKEVVALSAGTAAVHLALIACGVGPGDEVIVQSFTFCASSHPIKYLGAVPVFVDSEEDSWNMEPCPAGGGYKGPYREDGPETQGDNSCSPIRYAVSD